MIASEPIAVSPEVPDSRLGPELAAGPAGRFAVVWAEPTLPAAEADLLMLQLFAADGRPVGPRTTVSPQPADEVLGGPRIASPRVAWDVPGARLLVVWSASDPARPADPDVLVAQLVDGLSTPAPRDELCAMTGNRLRCVTATVRPDRDLLRIDFGRGVQNDETPFLTDLDGDGFTELCLRQRSNYVCDLAGDGRQGEVVIQNNLRPREVAGGDVNGDGVGDICRRSMKRSSVWFCNTAGRTSLDDTRLAFGPAGSRPFLGDADGDRVDELCLVLGGQLRCDTARDGGAAELFRPIPQLLLDRLADGATPLLADIDGNGQDELCVAFADRFQCDVVGVGLREIPIPGGIDFDTVDIPLVGNVDGL